MFVVVFNGWDIVDRTACWESAIWFRDRLNSLSTLCMEDGEGIYQIYYLD